MCYRGELGCRLKLLYLSDIPRRTIYRFSLISNQLNVYGTHWMTYIAHRQWHIFGRNDPTPIGSQPEEGQVIDYNHRHDAGNNVESFAAFVHLPILTHLASSTITRALRSHITPSARVQTIGIVTFYFLYKSNPIYRRDIVWIGPKFSDSTALGSSGCLACGWICRVSRRTRSPFPLIPNV